MQVPSGSHIAPWAWSETFAGLQRGVVDGQDNPYLTINAMKFDEVQDYIANLRYVFSLEPLVISESTFQGLSEEEQQAMIAAGEAATKASAQFLRDQEAEIKDVLVEKGVEIVDPANDEQEFIDLATSQVWPKHMDEIGGVEKFNEVLTTLGREPYQP